MISDPQQIPKTFRNKQKRRIALTFQQGICSNSRPHFDGGDGPDGQLILRPKLHQIPDTLYGGVFILLWIFRKQLMAQQLSIGPPAYDIRKRAPAIYPKLPHNPSYTLEGLITE